MEPLSKTLERIGYSLFEAGNAMWGWNWKAKRLVRKATDDLYRIAQRLEWDQKQSDNCEAYPKDWVRLDLMVAPDGTFHAVGGEREQGDGDQPYVGVQRIESRLVG